MKVGQIRYTRDQLDEVDLDFPIGRFVFPPRQAAGRSAVQHVKRGASGWAVIGEGNTRATTIHSSQAAAIKAAARIAGNKKSAVVVHKADGGILKKFIFSETRRNAATAH